MADSTYRFRLERVRALRERTEEQAKAELAGALMRRHECAEQVDAAAGHIDQARKMQVEFSSGTAIDLLARQAYLERVEQTHQVTVADLRRHDDDVAGRRRELTQASQAREALERLKEKGLAAHLREESRIERVVLDEIAGNGYWRRAA